MKKAFKNIFELLLGRWGKATINLLRISLITWESAPLKLDYVETDRKINTVN